MGRPHRESSSVYRHIRMSAIRAKRSVSGKTSFVLVAFVLIFGLMLRLGSSIATDQLADATRLAVSSSSSTTSSERPYEACFITCMYAKSKDETDTPADMSALQAANPSFKFFMYTNLEDLETPGWTKIIKDFTYKRYITQSRWGKFMSWKDPETKGCATIFYLDGQYEPKKLPADAFRAEAAAIRQSEFGLAQVKRGHSIMDEFKMILKYRKDIPENVNASIAWFQAQDDFNDQCVMYSNFFFGFDPLNLHFQQAANFLWSHYSQEKNSWRDQPLWCYTLDRFGIVPRQISILFEANLARIARNGHFYDASSNNDAAASNNKS